MLKLIDKALALVVKQETTDATERLSSQELDLGVRLVRVDETSRVHLNLLEINSRSTSGHSKLLPITSAMLAIRSRQIPQLRTMLLKQRVLREISSIPTRRKDYRPIRLMRRSIMGILNTNNNSSNGGVRHSKIVLVEEEEEEEEVDSHRLRRIQRRLRRGRLLRLILILLRAREEEEEEEEGSRRGVRCLCRYRFHRRALRIRMGMNMSMVDLDLDRQRCKVKVR